MMKKLLLPLAAAGLCACAIPQPGMYGSSPYGGFGMKRALAEPPQQEAAAAYVNEVIDIATEPPGARILVNDVPAGNSPLRHTVRRLWRGEPPYMALDTVKIEAFPVTGGHCVQSGIYGQNNLKVPSPINFNMANCKMQEYGQPLLPAK